MNPVIAVTSPGNMGAAIGGRLTAHGLKVLTKLDGRSAASKARAVRHGLEAVTAKGFAEADLILSILPPKDAVTIAEELAPALREARRKPIYVDCNAVSPETAKQIGAILSCTGANYVDGGIVGGPPREGYTPRLYVSGERARDVLALNKYGLDVRLVEGGVGAASALKLSYAGINKGLVGIGAAMVLAARRAGVEEPFLNELTESQRAVLTQLTRTVPDMFSKAERWAPEMEEIASYLGARGEAETFRGFAGLFERLAADLNGSKEEIGVLEDFFREAGEATKK